MSHANARLTPLGRRLLVDRIAAGQPVAQVARQMCVSRTTAWRWWRRWQAQGAAGLVDRPSVARSHPRRTPVQVEDRIVELRRARRLGPARIGGIVGVAPSTVHRVLVRHGLSRLAWLDRPSGQVIRRYERAVPGELVHIDVKKLGRVPDGGGWRVHGRDSSQHRHRDRRAAPGWDYVHAAVDDHSRLAYAEILSDETGPTCAAFLLRAALFFLSHGVSVREVITDNARNYTVSYDFQAALNAIDAHHLTIRPHCPWQNGKVERFNRTIQVEWAYHQVFATNAERADALDRWLDHYNTQRRHSAIGGLPPISRLS